MWAPCRCCSLDSEMVSSFILVVTTLLGSSQQVCVQKIPRLAGWGHLLLSMTGALRQPPSSPLPPQAFYSSLPLIAAGSQHYRLLHFILPCSEHLLSKVPSQSKQCLPNPVAFILFFSYCKVKYDKDSGPSMTAEFHQCDRFCGFNLTIAPRLNSINIPPAHCPPISSNLIHKEITSRIILAK